MIEMGADDAVGVAENQMVLAVEPLEMAADGLYVAGETQIAEVIHNVVGRHGVVPHADDLFVERVGAVLGAKLRAEAGDIGVGKMQIGCEVDIGHFAWSFLVFGFAGQPEKAFRLLLDGTKR